MKTGLSLSELVSVNKLDLYSVWLTINLHVLIIFRSLQA